MQQLQQPRRQFLRRCVLSGIAVLFNLGTMRSWARQSAEIRSIRFSAGQGKTSIIFDLSAPVQHNIFTLPDPDRVVIDFNDARLSADPGRKSLERSIIKDLRYATRNKTDIRLVLDLSKSASPKSFLLPPTGRYGHRLLVELIDKGKKVSKPIKTVNNPVNRLRDVVVAIDAGHGGRDPGAIGYRYRTKEKDVVLSIARRLEALVTKEKGMRAVMIRNQDVFLPLRTRIKRAHEQRADLFISIHADATRKKHIRGSSVYVLSQNGASSELARLLAERENAADDFKSSVKGDVLTGKEEPVARVILNLMQNGTLEASSELANDMLSELKRIGRLRSPRVEQAGFAVLKSPDIPSVLVETAFISNAKDERQLRSKKFQQSVAWALLRGIKKYLRENAPPGTLMADIGRTTHLIRSGETLSTIAQRYDIDIQTIRRHNALKGDRIRAGQVLRIPLTGG